MVRVAGVFIRQNEAGVSLFDFHSLQIENVHHGATEKLHLRWVKESKQQDWQLKNSNGDIEMTKTTTVTERLILYTSDAFIN